MSLNKPILVLDDLVKNSRSRRVRHLAFSLSKNLKLPLTLLHVQDIAPEIYLSFGHELAESLLASGKSELDKIRKTLGKNTKAIQAKGNPSQEVIRLSKGKKYSFVVQGTSNLTGIGALLLGSVAEGVIRSSSIPVLTLGPKAKATTLKSILVPTTLTGNTLAAEIFALNLAKKNKAKVFLLHSFMDSLHPILQTASATKRGEKELEPILESLRVQARKKLQECASQFQKAGLEVEIILDESRAGATQAILKNAKHIQAIVMGTHGRTIPEGLFFGKTARVVIMGSPVPVFTVKSSKE